MNFFRMIYHNLRYGAASTVIFIDNQVDAALAALARAIVFIATLVVLGTAIGGIGYWLDLYYVMRFAQWIYALSYFGGGALMVILAARMGVLITALPAGYNIIRTVVREVTSPIPFFEPLELPESISDDTAAFIYRLMWASLASLHAVSGFSIILAVYSNPLSFLVMLGATWGILYGALTVGSVTGTWLRRYGYANVIFSAGVFAGYLLTFPFPNIWTNFTNRWNGMWNSFGAMEALANTNYFVALLYFVAIVGLIISVAYAVIKKGEGFLVASGFFAMLLFLIFLGPRTVAAIQTSPTPFPAPPPSASNTNMASNSSVNYTSGSKTLKSKSSNCFVDANNPRGVVVGSVSAGDSLTIYATGTAVWKNRSVGNPTKYEEDGPEGTAPTKSPLMTREEYLSNMGDYLCPSANKGALIGKIGDGPWFLVGENFKGVVSSGGTLVLAVNDVDPKKQDVANWADNSKGFRVTVQVD